MMAARRNRIPLAEHIMNTLTRTERELRLRTVPKVQEVGWEWASAADRQAACWRIDDLSALCLKARAELARKGGA
jgi:hypothetical protein